MTKALNLSRRISGTSLAAMAISAVLAFASATGAQAWHNGRAHTGAGILGGAIVGGAIGGAVKGKKGIVPGAIIGGVVGGVAASSDRPRAAPAPRSRAPVYQDSLVYNIQVSLSRLGYNPGPIDGIYGQRTADAISAYEYNNQLPVTGQPDPGLLQHMQAQGG